LITSTDKRPLLSVVLSFRNEEDVLEELAARLETAFLSLPAEYELIFVNDASTDSSLDILVHRAKQNNGVKIINMSRRFGVSECVIAGMHYAKGDAVIYMDADLQDPPELIPELFEQWQQGADVVHTRRTAREGEPAFKLLLTDVAYRLIGAFQDFDLSPSVGDFKLLSRRAVNELLNLKEKTPYLRGLVAWVGFKQVIVPYVRQPRAGGVTHFPIFQRLFRDLVNLRGPAGMLIIGVTSFTLLPIMIFLLLGGLIFFGCVVALVVWIAFMVSRTNVPAWTGLLIGFLMLSGVQLVGLGTLGIYLCRIYQDVRGRPMYIVESAIGFDGANTV